MCDMYTCPVTYNETENQLWTSQESGEEDKVILETEITLKTGPNITMKIHEESRPNSVLNESEEDTEKQGVIKILNEDSESDYYEGRRSPRKVRFGGESFKLRTPESDSSLQDEDGNDSTTIKITVTDAISIRTRKSLIPIRISSLPSTPQKTVLSRQHYKSAPNLTADSSSRIPVRKKNEQNLTLNIGELNGPKASTNTNPKVLKHSRAEDVLSPIPVHDEIEVFHNLTRSPNRSGNSSPKPEENAKKDETAYNSFTICNENSAKSMDKVITNDGKKASLQQSLSSLTSDDEIWSKSEALDSLVKMLKEPGTCESLEPGPATLLFEALFACHHRDRLHSLADDALITLIQGIRPEVLEQCLQRLTQSICKMGAASGVRCALAIMKKIPPKKLQEEILTKSFSHRTREGALQILLACARLYPRVDVEVTKIAEFAAAALRDRRRRVRHASLETLAATAQISSVNEIFNIVEAAVKDSQEFDEVMRVVRTRLSRKQLPTINLDGSIRYSSPTEQSESDWITSGIKSASPMSSASSSTPSVNYWMHNSRHDNQFNNGSTLIKELSESYKGDIFDDPSKIWPKNEQTNKALRGNSLRPVYILQPDLALLENGKNGRGHRKYDRGRSFSPAKPYKGQFQVEYAHHSGTFNDVNKHFGSSEFNPRQHYPEATFHHGFRKSFSSDQLYFNNRLPPKNEAYSFSLSSRSSSTSTGSSTKSGFWSKDFRSAIPVPITETKLKIRHSTSSIVSSGGPVIAKRFSPQHLPNGKDNNSVQSLPPPPPKSSGSDSSSGYFTPSPPEKHPPAFIKVDTEERLSSDNNLEDCVDSSASKSASVNDGSLKPSANHEVNDCLGEAINDNYPSVESLNLNDNQDKRPPSRGFAEPIPARTEIRRKSKSVVDLPNFLPQINSTRKIINSAPPRNEESINNNNNNNNKNDESINNNNNNNSVDTYDHLPPAPMDYATEQEIITKNAVTVTKSTLEKRFSRNSSRKSIRVTPRTILDPTPRPPSKPKDLLQQIFHQMDNHNDWESTVEGLQGLTKLARQHPEVIEQHMHHVCLALAKQIKNLRSQVARAACNTATELFLSCKMEMELEEIACPLLQRTADTNKFLRADANAALDVMCEQLPVHRVIPVVTSRGCGHQNAVVRAAAVRMLGAIVKRLGAERTFQLPKELRDKLLLAGANALADGNLEARSQGKNLFGYLIAHSNFQRYLNEAVPQNLLRHISKCLASIITKSEA